MSEELDTTFEMDYDDDSEDENPLDVFMLSEYLKSPISQFTEKDGYDSESTDIVDYDDDY